jgi:hypothetical protein
MLLTNKKLGRDLAELSVTLFGNNEVLSFAKDNGFNEVETTRFIFGLSIINIALSIFAVNFLVSCQRYSVISKESSRLRNLRFLPAVEMTFLD